MDNQSKILFEFEDFNGEYAIESIWSTKLKNGYKIDNIPFYVKGFALGDVVSVQEKEGELYVVDLIEESGHSTIRILFNDINDIQQTRAELTNLGCESEISDNTVLISVDIPPTVQYEQIKKYLETGESADKWGYQEACLAQ